MIRESTSGRDFMGRGRGSSGLSRVSRTSRSRSTSPHLSPLTSSTPDLLGRLNFANLYGLLFSGSRDLHRLLGYLDNPTYDDYRSYYDRGDLARRVVDIFPLSIWSKDIFIQEDPDPDIETPFEKEVSALFERFDLWRQIVRVDKLAGIGHYSTFLIGAAGDPSTDLPRLSRLEDILYVSPYSEGQMKILDYETNKSSPRFGLPLSYTLAQTRNHRGGLISTPSPDTSIPRIHWTRVIHWANGCLDSEVFGTPRLQCVINKFVDLLKQVGGGSEAAYQRMDPPTIYDADPDYELGTAEREEFKAEIEALRQGLTRYALTSGITPHQSDNKVFNFDGNTSVLIEIIAGSHGIPVRIFRGSERGEQASTQDRNNFRDLIDSHRTEDSEPNLRRLINRFGEHGLFSSLPPVYEIVWPKWSEKLTQKEKADIASAIAAANIQQVNSEGALIMTADEIRGEVFDLEPLEVSEIRIKDEGGGEGGSKDEGEGGSKDEGEGDKVPDSGPASLSRLSHLSPLSPLSLPISILANEPEWSSVHRVADAYTPSFAASIISVWKSASSKIKSTSLSSLESALESGDLYKTLTILNLALTPMKQELDSVISEGVLKISNEAGLSALRSARARGGWFKKKKRVGKRGAGKRVEGKLDKPEVKSFSTFEANFATSSPRAVSYAATRSSILVTEIDQSIRTGLQSLIAHGIRDGVPPRRLAREIVQSVGLRSDQIRAVSNLRARLEAAEPGSIVRGGSLRIRIPDKGITESQIAAHTSNYSNQLLNQRGELIARTETLRSANEGQKELWKQAQESGSLPLDQKRVWLATGDNATREEHLDLDGQVVGIDESFDPAIEPGEEPNCRCAQGLADESDIAAWEDRKNTEESEVAA